MPSQGHADVIDIALARGAQAKAAKGTELGERGFASEAAFYSVDHELLDYRRPHVREIDAMVEHDPYVDAIEQAIILPMLGQELIIGDAENDKGQGDLCRTVFFSSPQEGGMTTPWEIIHRQLCGAFFRRRAFFEIIWHVIEGGRWDGATAFKNLAYRPAATCRVRVDDNGTFAGFVQEGFRGPKKKLKEPFNADKSFVYVHDQAMRPLEGRSMADPIFTQYIDKLKIKRLWFSHLQDVALGSIKGSYTGSDPDGIRKVREALRELRGGGIWVRNGNEEDAEYMEGSRQGQEFLDAIHFLNGEMGVAALAMFLGLGQKGDRGSWALSRDQSDFFLQSLEAKQKEKARAIREYAIAKLVAKNFDAGAALPPVSFAPLSRDAKEKALALYQAIIIAQHSMPPPLFEKLEELAFGALDVNRDEVIEEALKEGASLEPTNPPQIVQALASDATTSVTGEKVEPGGAGAEGGEEGGEGEEGPQPGEGGDDTLAEPAFTQDPDAFGRSVAALQTQLRAATGGRSEV